MLKILSKEYYGNTLSNWLLVCFLLLMLVILRKIFLFICNRFLLKKLKKIIERKELKDIDNNDEKTFSEITQIGLKHLIKGNDKKNNENIQSPIYAIINDIFNLGSLIVSVITIRYICNLLILPSGLVDFINTVTTITTAIITAWLFQRTYLKLHEEVLTPITDATKNKLDDQLLGPVKHCILFLIWAFAIIIALENAGYHIGAILTGLGIGGLAIAMAAKDTIANILGGFTILADNPFFINDYIRIGEHQGYVQKIGIRSTHLASYGGSIIAIPNAQFTDGVIENFSRVKTKKVSVDLYLNYDNSENQIKKAIKILQNIATTHKNTTEANDDTIVSFYSFGKSAIILKFIYHIDLKSFCNETHELDSQIQKITHKINDIRTNINLQIFTQFQKARIKFQEALEINNN